MMIEDNAGKHRVALAVAEQMGMPYEQVLPLAKRAVRVLGEGASLEEYLRYCRKWRTTVAGTRG